MTRPTESPTVAQLQAARQAAGMTQAEAAALVNLAGALRWSEYECGRRNMDVARWELFLLLTDQHPSLQRPRKRSTKVAA